MLQLRTVSAAVLAAFFAMAVAACPAVAGDADDEAAIESAIRGVLGLERVTFGGRVFIDWMEWAGVDGGLETAYGEEAFASGTEFRCARMQMKGRVAERVGFFFDYDFAGGQATLKDAYIEFGEIPPIGFLQVGHIREPLGLEARTSGKYLTFVEPALTSAFYPWRNTGVMLRNVVADDILTYEAGVFRDADAFGAGSGDNELSYTARVTAAAWRGGDGRMLHIGASYSLRHPDEGVALFKARPENHLGPVLVDTGELEVESVSLLGLEAAVGLGPVLLQWESVSASVDRLEESVWLGGTRGCCGNPLDFSAYYLQGSWMITGEPHPFSKGVPARIKPDRPLGDGGRGALELAVRLSSIDLTDEDGIIDGGELTNTTFGLNWYTSANSRIMLNYVISSYAGSQSEERDEEVKGTTSAFLTRFQIDF